jgi:hypothetical protein
MSPDDLTDFLQVLVPMSTEVALKLARETSILFSYFESPGLLNGDHKELMDLRGRTLGTLAESRIRV